MEPPAGGSRSSTWTAGALGLIGALLLAFAVAGPRRASAPVPLPVLLQNPSTETRGSVTLRPTVHGLAETDLNGDAITDAIVACSGPGLTVCAYDGLSFTFLWHVRLEDQSPGVGILVARAHDGRLVMAASFTKSLYVISLQGPKLERTLPLDLDVREVYLSAGNSRLAWLRANGVQGDVVAVDLLTGSVTRDSLPGDAAEESLQMKATKKSFAVKGDALDRSLQALDPATGAERWKVPAKDMSYEVSPTRVYIQHHWQTQAKIEVLDSKTGTVLGALEQHEL